MGGRGCLSAKQHREQRQTPARRKTASLQLEKGARKTFPCLSPPFTSAWERETLAEVLTVPARRPRTRSRREGDREEGEGGSWSNGARRRPRGRGSREGQGRKRLRELGPAPHRLPGRPAAAAPRPPGPAAGSAAGMSEARRAETHQPARAQTARGGEAREAGRPGRALGSRGPGRLT